VEQNLRGEIKNVENKLRDEIRNIENALRGEIKNEEVKKSAEEMAVRSDMPPERKPDWFYFLIQRIDNVERNLLAEFKEEISKLDTKIDGVTRWVIGLLITVIIGFGGIIAALLK